MLSGITNFLFGGDASSSEMAVDCDNLDLRTTLADNEWVFVDKSRSISPARAVATGPLEDLLIEHPSMSVYGATDGGAVVTATVRVRQPPRRPRAVADRAGLSAGVAAAAAAAAAARRQKTGGAARKKEERSNRLGRRAASGKELRRCNAYALRSAPAAQRRC